MKAHPGDFAENRNSRIAAIALIIIGYAMLALIRSEDGLRSQSLS
jgi:hypothetical protein